MRELPVRLPPSAAARPKRPLWREAVVFCASFAASFYVLVVMMVHISAVAA